MHSKMIKELPDNKSRNRKSTNNKLKRLIIDFFDSGDDYNEIIFDSDEYSSSVSLYTGAKKAIYSLNIPVEVVMIHGGVYLRRVNK